MTATLPTIGVARRRIAGYWRRMGFMLLSGAVLDVCLVIRAIEWFEARDRDRVRTAS